MAAKMQKPRDVISGFLIIAIGIVFFVLGLDLDFGTTFRMGPGYFPMLLSVLMLLLGISMVVPALRGSRLEGTLDHVPWRGLALTIGPTIFFGATIRGLGLLPVLFFTVLVTAAASRLVTWRSAVFLAAGLAVFCTFLFVQALGLPLPVIGRWLWSLGSVVTLTAAD